MTARRWIAFPFISLGLIAFWGIGQQEPTVPPAELHKPSAKPDRIILTWSGDPATTQSVTWRTAETTSKGVAQLALATDGPAFRTAATLLPARTELFESDISKANYHSVNFTGLQPDTQYVYRVGDGFNWSEWNQFRTAAAGTAPLEFLYVGDAQNEIYSMWSRLIRQGYSDAPKLRFLVHAGDLINTNGKDEQWGEWHQAPGWINRSVPSLPTPGNHEYGKIKEVRQLSPHWRPQFTLPANGVPGLEETNYTLDIQGVRMVVLNSNEKHKEQAEWLDRLLASNPNRWTILTFHHPIYSTAKGRDNKDLRELWQPLFDKYAVDLVLTGHDHSYGRSNLAIGAGATRGKAGTVYVVSVSGPKQYPIDRSEWMHRAAEDTQLYQLIRVNGDKLHFEARTARGVLYDSFELRKRKGRANSLTNLVPKTPENRRPAPAEPSGL